MDEPVPFADLVDKVRAAADGDALSCLARSAAVARMLEATGQRLLDHFVEEARAQGLSWTQVGAATGVSKQAAQRRFGQDARPTRWFVMSPDEEVFAALGSVARRAVMAAERTAAAEERAADGEDVLLGVLGERRGGAAQAMQAFAIEFETIATRLTQDRPDTEQVATERGLAPSAVSVLVSGAAVASRLGAPIVGTGHLLIAILEADGRGAAVLSQAGLSVTLLENWLRNRPTLE